MPVVPIGSATVIPPEILRAALLLTIVPDAHDPAATQVPLELPNAEALLMANVPCEIVVVPE